jgi:hypothetical protein
MTELSLTQKIAFGAGGVALFGCVLSAVIGVGRARDAGKLGASSAEPENLTLAELIARGPEGNPNVRLSEFQFDEKVLIHKTRGKYGEQWDYVWLSARPRGSHPDSRFALVRNKRLQDQDDLNQFSTVRALPGLVINKLEKLGDEELRLLRGTYPDTDFDRVVLIDAYQEPPGQLASFNATFSVVAGLVAVACFFVACWPWIPGLGKKKRRKRRRRVRTEEFEED